ncbi:MAG: GNAT family N-acetyltransferase [Pirellulales bacterium]|nr:GNAT family N-acetyltransferase [Pirellulales bacterium]
MPIRKIENLKDLQPYRRQWDELAGGCLFRSWNWLTTWWKHYGEDVSSHKLYVMLLYEGETSSDCRTTEPMPDGRAGERLIAILPCYRAISLARGSVLRLLGDGEVCSDYLGPLVSPDDESRAAEHFAEHLHKNSLDWDLGEFTAVGANNSSMDALIASLQTRGCELRKNAGPSCWSVQLPASWEEFLTRQSKSHRKQLRQLERRMLDTQQATWRLVESQSEFDMAWSILVDLHQRRRRSLGEPGCFASERWAAFHQEVAGKLLAAGQLRLSWLEIAGQPIAAEYHMAGNNTTFAYQGGVDPDRLDEQPGRLSMICALQRAIDEGHTQFDLLRGDEPYKPHWRAVPEPTADYQIVPARVAARWRYQSWSTLRRAGRLARQFANLLS